MRSAPVCLIKFTRRSATQDLPTEKPILLRGCTRGRSPLVGGAAKQRGGTRPHRLAPEGKRERGD